MRHSGTLRNGSVIILYCDTVKGQEAYEVAAKTMKLCLLWCQVLSSILFYSCTALLFWSFLRLVDEQLWRSVSIDDILPWCPDAWRARISVAGHFCAGPLLSTAVSCSLKDHLLMHFALHYHASSLFYCTPTCISRLCDVLLCAHLQWHSFASN